MSNQEQHERLCGILAKLVDSVLTSEELLDLASALGLKLEDWYYPKEERKAA